MEKMEIRVNKEKCRKMQENASRQSGVHLEGAFRAKCAKNCYLQIKGAQA